MEITLFTSYLFYTVTFFTKNVLLFIALYLSYRFFNMLSMPVDSAIIAKLSPPKRRGMGFAISFLPGNFVRIIAPLIAAYIADYWGLYPIFVVSSATFFIGLAVLKIGVKIR
jgi:MFS family permease